MRTNQTLKKARERLGGEKKKKDKKKDKDKDKK